MAIIISETKKSKNYLIIILGILILLILIFIWKIFLQKPEKISAPIISKPPEIKISLGTLNSPILKDLQPFEEIKPFEESFGRENPFLPY